MDIENIASFKHTLLTGVNLFVGAGFSVLAHDNQGQSMPVGGMLAKELRTHFDASASEALTLAQLYTVLARTKKDAVDQFLRDRFMVAQFDKRYANITRIHADAIFTTNIDNLPHRIYESSAYTYLNDIDFAGPKYADRRAIDLVMLHGSVLDPDRPFRFGTLDVASSFSADPDRWRYLRHRLQQSPTLFLGYSLQDAAALEAIRSESGGGDGEVWMQVRPNEKNSDLVDYYRALGFQLVFAETDQFLNFLGFNLPNPGDLLPRNRKLADTRTLFPTEAIPVRSEVPSRPIADFFQGAAPGWSDVFARTLHHVSHFRKLTESVRAGKSVIMTGIPGSGKTTLLMQIASELDFDGHKLMLDGATKAKAEMLIRLLDGAPALVLLDDFTNDIDAFEVLVQAKDIIVVAADRDYNLSSSLHRVTRGTASIMEVTDLTDEDLQDLRATIPSELRKATFVPPETSKGTRPSIFEFIQANVSGPTLRERFERALRELGEANPQMAEMLLLASYVHSCRTPLSMDMAIGYFGRSVDTHDEMYKLIKDTGQILREYEGDLATDDQDYFAARSALAAESVLSAATGSQLRGMLLAFHSNISHVRIAEYHVFKRKGFDSHLFGRAFADVDEACVLYDDIYARDPSPYTLQQKALLLSRRKRHADAFREIDRAVTKARRSNWTIRNSYAKILFRANIDLAPDQPDVRSLLDRAISVLTECYKSDRRQSIHALVYADFATQYAEIFRDEISTSYLQQADDFLIAVASSEPWMRGVRPLQLKVRGVLRDLE